MPDNRIHYLDNIRVALTAVVIFHHLLISYGAPGGWYYKQFEISQLDLPTLMLLVFSTAFNQAYFMGFFFFLSGYFSSRSLQKTAAVKFLGQRLLRLGVPVLLFVYLISPLQRLLSRKILFQQKLSLENVRQIYDSIRFGPELGPMWFVLLLLILSFIFLPILRKDPSRAPDPAAPSQTQIILFALAVGSLTFLVRIFLPVGSVFQPLNLQLPHTTQYVFLYLAGSLAYRRRWLDELEMVDYRKWIPLISGLLAALPVVFILSGGLEGDVAPALGGKHWQSLAYSIWEQLLCVSLIVVLLKLFQSRMNWTTVLLSELSASSYAAFLIHPLALVVLTALYDPVHFHPLLKIGTMVIPSLVFSALAASLVRRVPGLNRAL